MTLTEVSLYPLLGALKHLDIAENGKVQWTDAGNMLVCKLLKQAKEPVAQRQETVSGTLALPINMAVAVRK